MKRKPRAQVDQATSKVSKQEEGEIQDTDTPKTPPTSQNQLVEYLKSIEFPENIEDESDNLISPHSNQVSPPINKQHFLIYLVAKVSFSIHSAN